MKYNLEKVLYLADQPKKLNVSKEEHLKRTGDFQETDLERQVRLCLDNELITKVSEDSTDVYYEATLKGKEKLLTLQIKYRKGVGKSTERHEQELSDIRFLLESN